MTVDHDPRTSGGDARVGQLLRRAGDLTLPPPPRVWDGLLQALRTGPAHPPEGADVTDPEGADITDLEGADVTDLAARRAAHRATGPRARRGRAGGRTRGWGSPYALLAAAAAGALVVVAGDWAVDRSTPGDEVLASAGLGPVDDVSDTLDVSARAQVVTHDGLRVLRVDLDETIPAPDGYLEVWLLRPDVSGMVTLGVLEGDHAELVLPEGVSLEEYPVVDVSVESVDGDPAHGGHSVLRGQLAPGDGVSALGVSAHELDAGADQLAQGQ